MRWRWLGMVAMRMTQSTASRMERCTASQARQSSTWGGAGTVGAEPVGIEVARLGAVRHVVDEEARSQT